MYSPNGHYRHYIRDTLQLFAFLDEGKFNSDEAERLRDAMEEPWLQLDKTEKTRLRGLVEDLNYIREERRPTFPAEAGRSILKFASELRDVGHIDEALKVVRTFQAETCQPILSYFRGRAWLALGENDVALEFLKDAIKLDKDDQFRLLDMYMQVLRMVDLKAAVALADKVLSAPDTQPASRVAFAVEAKQAVIDEASPDALAQFASLVPVAQDVLDRMRDGETTLPLIVSMTTALLAHLAERSGDKEQAYKAMTTLIEAENNNPILYALRGNIFFPAERGVTDYLTAVRTGVKVAWPYLRLADYYLKQENHAESAKVCGQGLQLNGLPSKSTGSELFNMLAISKAGLGSPQWEIEELFQIAIKLDPNNERPARNLRTYHEALKKMEAAVRGTIVAENWEQPPEEFLRAIENLESSRERRQIVQSALSSMAA